MSDTTNTVEHHWHEPSQGQVMKALYQYLTDQGITAKTLEEIVTKKIADVMGSRIHDLLVKGHFDKIIVQTCVESILSEKKCFDRPDNSGYGFHNRIRDLLQKELCDLVLRNYTITVNPKGEPK